MHNFNHSKYFISYKQYILKASFVMQNLKKQNIKKILKHDLTQINLFTKLLDNIFLLYKSFNLFLDGSVAQWLEQGAHNALAVGSNPTRSSINYSVLQSADCNILLRI